MNKRNLSFTRYKIASGSVRYRIVSGFTTFSSHERGFTLIELLVAVGIIGILAAGLIITIDPGKQMAKARDATRRSDLKQLQVALEAYHNDNGHYPKGGATESKCTYFGDGAWGNHKGYSGDDGWIPGLAPDYIGVLPGDPNVNGVTARCYIYYSDTPGSRYLLSAHMGKEALYTDHDLVDPMVRSLSDCSTPTSVQQTFMIDSDGTRCWW